MKNRIRNDFCLYFPNYEELWSSRWLEINELKDLSFMKEIISISSATLRISFHRWLHQFQPDTFIKTLRKQFRYTQPWENSYSTQNEFYPLPLTIKQGECIWQKAAIKILINILVAKVLESLSVDVERYLILSRSIDKKKFIVALHWRMNYCPLRLYFLFLDISRSFIWFFNGNIWINKDTIVPQSGNPSIFTMDVSKSTLHINNLIANILQENYYMHKYIILYSSGTKQIKNILSEQ